MPPNEPNIEQPGLPDPGAAQPAKERARVLLELLREQRSEASIAPLIEEARDVAGNGPLGNLRPAPETLRHSARELLERIGRKTAPKAAREQGAMSPKVVRSTIAALVDGTRLASEHPAVIAVVIENQPRSTQTAVMRALPGKIARQVRRALLALPEA